MNKTLKAFLIIFGILFSGIAGLFLIIHIAFDGKFTGPSYEKKDLIENFKVRQDAILDAKNYYKSMLPDGVRVKLEFENDKELGIFHINSDFIENNNWNLKVNSPKVDSLLAELKWTGKELKILKAKLDKANCISVSGNEPVFVGWQRSGMGMFSYVIFDQNLNHNEINDYNDGCRYIFYKKNLVLEYTGGVKGMQCFHEFYRNKK